MSRSSVPDTVTSTGPAARPAAVSAPRPRDHRDPVARAEPADVMTSPLAGEPGHGSTAFLRNQPIRIVDGHSQGFYTEVYELICPGCGDHARLDYSEIPPRLQRLRGPHSLEAGLEAFHKHQGTPLTGETRSEASGTF